MNGPLCRPVSEEWELMQLTLRERPTSQFAIIANDTNDFIGQCGFLCSTSAPTEAEFWCILRRKYWRGGLAREIGMTMPTRAFSTLKMTRVTGVIHPENRASLALVEQLGFRLEGACQKSGWQYGHLIYVLNPETYQKAAEN
jgi:[ribosomal protein S5]-alanine N-acetyltransferase